MPACKRALGHISHRAHTAHSWLTTRTPVASAGKSLKKKANHKQPGFVTNYFICVKSSHKEQWKREKKNDDFPTENVEKSLQTQK